MLKKLFSLTNVDRRLVSFAKRSEIFRNLPFYPRTNTNLEGELGVVKGRARGGEGDCGGDRGIVHR
ncbi:hypothetical protein HY04_09975 [Kaistella antarctica]|uniref:Uncharacterized protein n=1 Tax=Kaistella antarctica TaxID=266748 RepID=A0ABR4TXY3_9FLAO|nr:hypothetical protein HY04_09975 [Kaistella antarctica]